MADGLGSQLINLSRRFPRIRKLIKYLAILIPLLFALQSGCKKTTSAACEEGPDLEAIPASSDAWKLEGVGMLIFPSGERPNFIGQPGVDSSAFSKEFEELFGANDEVSFSYERVVDDKSHSCTVRLAPTAPKYSAAILERLRSASDSRKFERVKRTD